PRPQPWNHPRFGGCGLAEIDQRAAEAAVRECLQSFPRGRDCEALIPTASEKSKEFRLCHRIDFDHERSLLNHGVPVLIRWSLAATGAPHIRSESSELHVTDYAHKFD